ncbi:hypothetical protein Ddye_014236 [Dipteronia dyeriana]|uniref:Uncharacterized protein n=1 Tax=Dipteronia dyeriana TaxID=168575 RepID=A0AAD9X7U2_9ROSI|nr:hypothetical protein Ddye_014236 [Dipteronia dyeriana]
MSAVTIITDLGACLSNLEMELWSCDRQFTCFDQEYHTVEESEIQNPHDHQCSTKQSWNGTKYFLLGSEVQDSINICCRGFDLGQAILEGRQVGTVWIVEVCVALQWKWKEYHILLDMTAKYVLEIMKIG